MSEKNVLSLLVLNVLSYFRRGYNPTKKFVGDELDVLPFRKSSNTAALLHPRSLYFFIIKGAYIRAMIAPIQISKYNANEKYAGHLSSHLVYISFSGFLNFSQTGYFSKDNVINTRPHTATNQCRNNHKHKSHSNHMR